MKICSEFSTLTKNMLKNTENLTQLYVINNVNYYQNSCW